MYNTFNYNIPDSDELKLIKFYMTTNFYLNKITCIPIVACKKMYFYFLALDTKKVVDS